MKIYVHHITGAATSGSIKGQPLNQIAVWRLNTETFEVFFHNGAEVVPLAGGSTGVFVTKESGKPTDLPVLADTEWTPPATVDGGFVFELFVAGDKVDQLLINRNDVSCKGQIVWWVGGKRRSTGLFDFVIRQTYWLGSEDVPPPGAGGAIVIYGLKLKPDGSVWKRHGDVWRELKFVGEAAAVTLDWSNTEEA